MLPTDWLSCLKDRPRSRKWASRPHRIRVRQSCLGDWLLEDRVLLAGLVRPSDTVPSS